ncbi:TetR/AcrR family transcriptional regulator [Corynebacterium nuruki]|uniref:TetR/AcrR family transcriptional regulator n=1 Tax=Corynebacterium nuruki TaxID=1032851 RepID=UPI0039BFF882
MTDNAPQPSLREQKKEETRRALSRAAAELLLAEGNEGMTVAAIAERAGVSTRTFHNYFPRREDALLTFIEFTVDEWRLLVEQAPDGEDPLSTMQRLVTERIDDRDGTAGLAGNPGSLLNLMSIGDHLSYVTGPQDKERVRHLADGLLEALYRRPGHQMSRQAVALLVISSLAAGAIAVESAQQHADPAENTCLPPWAAVPGGRSQDPGTVLDDEFTVLRTGFGG